MQHWTKNRLQTILITAILTMLVFTLVSILNWMIFYSKNYLVKAIVEIYSKFRLNAVSGLVQAEHSIINRWFQLASLMRCSPRMIVDEAYWWKNTSRFQFSRLRRLVYVMVFELFDFELMTLVSYSLFADTVFEVMVLFLHYVINRFHK